MTTVRDLRKGIAALHRAAPAASTAFTSLHEAGFEDSPTLPKWTKELMAVVVSVVTHCEGCITWHLDAAIKAGASREAVVEALGVAMVMGGGPATIYASKALASLEELAGDGDASTAGTVT